MTEAPQHGRPVGVGVARAKRFVRRPISKWCLAEACLAVAQ
jgi:hypothetical protein